MDILLIIALVLFGIDAVWHKSLVAAGLAFWVASLVF